MACAVVPVIDAKPCLPLPVHLATERSDSGTETISTPPVLCDHGEQISRTDVREHPFAHEQLYIEMSRVRNRRDILMLTRPSHLLDGKALTKNVVYPELLPSSARGRQAAPA